MVSEQVNFDVIVIGAGIAGASVAARLAADVSVLLLEMESQPGYHTTGRSAALFAETYGPEPIRALTRASSGFFDQPPDGFTETRLLSPRGALLIARADQLDALENFFDESAPVSDVSRMNTEQSCALAPLLRADYVAASVHEKSARDIDVHALHQGFLRLFRSLGGTIQTNARVSGLARGAQGWEVRVGGQDNQLIRRGQVVVNAAGAWADHIGSLAGLRPIGLQPKRRTAMTVAAPTAYNIDAMPAVIDIDELFYLKPEVGHLLVSPADETPSEPCDAQPEEMDIAVCVDRIQTAFNIEVSRLQSKWAGLRSFVGDKSPVCGFDADETGFFWLAGQGGYGIQSSPALSEVAAALVQRRNLPARIIDQGFDSASVSPERLPRR